MGARRLRGLRSRPSRRPGCGGSGRGGSGAAAPPVSPCRVASARAPRAGGPAEPPCRRSRHSRFPLEAGRRSPPAAPTATPRARSRRRPPGPAPSHRERRPRLFRREPPARPLLVAWHPGRFRPGQSYLGPSLRGPFLRGWPRRVPSHRGGLAGRRTRHGAYDGLGGPALRRRTLPRRGFCRRFLHRRGRARSGLWGSCPCGGLFGSLLRRSGLSGGAASAGAAPAGAAPAAAAPAAPITVSPSSGDWVSASSAPSSVGGSARGDCRIGTSTSAERMPVSCGVSIGRGGVNAARVRRVKLRLASQKLSPGLIALRRDPSPSPLRSPHRGWPAAPAAAR